MSIFGGMFKGKPAAPATAHLDRIIHALRHQLNLQVLPPPPDVSAILTSLTDRELLHFDNMQTMAGMQSLFQACGIQAHVDPLTESVSLALVPPPSDAPADGPTELARPVIRVGEQKARIHVTAPAAPPPTTAVVTGPAIEFAPLPAGLEHLASLEPLLLQLVDLFVRHGKLTTGDKDVLRNIRPADGSLAARLAALERWQAEVTRRIRGFTVPRATAQLTLGGAENEGGPPPVESLERRLDGVITWTAKLIKAFEHTGVRFHNKPVWLPH